MSENVCNGLFISFENCRKQCEASNSRARKGRYTRGNLLPQHAPATRFRSKAPSSAPTISSEKNMLRNKTFAPEFCSLISSSKSVTRFCFRSKLPRVYFNFSLRERVSGASSLVCTGWGTYPGACFRSKLLRVYWLEYLPGSVFRERVSGLSSPVCTGLNLRANQVGIQ